MHSFAPRCRHPVADRSPPVRPGFQAGTVLARQVSERSQSPSTRRMRPAVPVRRAAWLICPLLHIAGWHLHRGHTAFKGVLWAHWLLGGCASWWTPRYSSALLDIVVCHVRIGGLPANGADQRVAADDDERPKLKELPGMASNGNHMGQRGPSLISNTSRHRGC